MSGLEISLLVLVVVLVALSIFLLVDQERLENRVDSQHRQILNLTAEIKRLELRDAEVKRHAETLLIHMAPLVEKTDWMTGRWHGKFEQLVQMENRRNDAAEHIRNALLAMPGIRDFTKRHGQDLWAGAITTGLQEIVR